MALAGAAGGAARASMDLLQQQMVQQQMEQAQQIQQQRAAIQLAQLQEQMRRTAVQEQRQGRQDQIGAAEAVTSALDTQFDPDDALDVEVSPIQASQIAGTPSAGRLREIPTLNARPVAPGAGSVDQRPTIGVRRLSPTGEQRQARDTEQAFDALTSDPDMPASVRRVIQLQRRGVQGVTPEDVEAPEAKAARLAAEDERVVTRSGRIADAQAAAAARHRTSGAGQEWVLRDGTPTPIQAGTAQPGDLPYDPVAARQDGSDDGPSPYSLERTTRTLQSVDELLGQVNRWTTGFGSVLSNIPESDARNFRAQLDTLKANIAFNELTQMREASKTGGALGQVSNMEIGLLQSALGALDQAQDPEQFKGQLQKIRESIERWRSAVGAEPGGAAEPSGVLELIRDAQGRLVPKGGA